MRNPHALLGAMIALVGTYGRFTAAVIEPLITLLGAQKLQESAPDGKRPLASSLAREVADTIKSIT